jgi:hypothetical protein
MDLIGAATRSDVGKAPAQHRLGQIDPGNGGPGSCLDLDGDASRSSGYVED